MIVSRRIVIPLLLLAGCAKEEKKPAPPPTVQVATPLAREVRDEDVVVGRFVSIDQVELRPRVTGYVQRVTFRDGQDVRRGDLLFEIDPRPYQAVLDQARASAVRARATARTALVERDRARALLEARAGSEQEVQTRQVAYEQAQADVASADANTRQAALNVGFTHVRAPISGRVSDRRVSAGNLVTTDTTLLTTIVTLDPIRFAFETPESVFLKFGPSRGRGAPVAVRLQNQGEFTTRGRVEFIDNAVDTASATMRGRAVFANPGHRIAPGMFGQMRVAGAQPYRAMLVPDEAVQSDQNRQLVYVVGRDGKVAERAVQVGPLVGGLRAIRSGLKPDERVVIGGIQRAKPGQKVTARPGRIIPKAASTGADEESIQAPLADTAIVVGGER